MTGAGWESAGHEGAYLQPSVHLKNGRRNWNPITRGSQAEPGGQVWGAE